MVGISNVSTNVVGRVDSDKNISKERRDELVELAEKYMPYSVLHVWNANINGIIIQLRTNDPHLIDFWIENWFPAALDGVRPHGTIYAAMGVPNEKPYAYYNSETKTAIFLNTNYYGQCKSWALGIVADIMEIQHDIHSLHSAVIDVGGTGVCIIAPTGTGKSTTSYGLVLSMPNARMHSDDWTYVDYIGDRASASISERKFYIRTDIAAKFPKIAEIFNRCKLENVKDEDYAAFPNSRAILDPLWIGGPDKFIYTTRIRVVVLLRRDETSPAEVKLDSDEAIKVLKEGAYMVLPGSGSKEDWGKIKYEPWYNPYLLVRNEQREQMQTDFFHRLFDIAPCYILNTGVEKPHQTQERVKRMIKEVSEKVKPE